MRHLSFIVLFLFSFAFLPKAHENKWKDRERSIPPISSVAINGYALCIHFDIPVDTMLLEIWDAEGTKACTEYIVSPPVGDYYIALDNLAAGSYTFRLSNDSGYWDGDFSK